MQAIFHAMERPKNSRENVPREAPQMAFFLVSCGGVHESMNFWYRPVNNKPPVNNNIKYSERTAVTNQITYEKTVKKS